MAISTCSIVDYNKLSNKKKPRIESLSSLSSFIQSLHSQWIHLVQNAQRLPFGLSSGFWVAADSRRRQQLIAVCIVFASGVFCFQFIYGLAMNQFIGRAHTEEAWWHLELDPLRSTVYFIYFNSSNNFLFSIKSFIRWIHHLHTIAMMELCRRLLSVRGTREQYDDDDDDDYVSRLNKNKSRA